MKTLILLLLPLFAYAQAHECEEAYIKRDQCFEYPPSAHDVEIDAATPTHCEKLCAYDPACKKATFYEDWSHISEEGQRKCRLANATQYTHPSHFKALYCLAPDYQNFRFYLACDKNENTYCDHQEFLGIGCAFLEAHNDFVADVADEEECFQLCHDHNCHAAELALRKADQVLECRLMHQRVQDYMDVGTAFHDECSWTFSAKCQGDDCESAYEPAFCGQMDGTKYNLRTVNTRYDQCQQECTDDPHCLGVEFYSERRANKCVLSREPAEEEALIETPCGTDLYEKCSGLPAESQAECTADGGDFRRIKCAFLRGNNPDSVEHPDVTVAECLDICKNNGLCQSVEYVHTPSESDAVDRPTCRETPLTRYTGDLITYKGCINTAITKCTPCNVPTEVMGMDYHCERNWHGWSYHFTNKDTNELALEATCNCDGSLDVHSYEGDALDKVFGYHESP